MLRRTQHTKDAVTKIGEYLISYGIEGDRDISISDAQFSLVSGEEAILDVKLTRKPQALVNILPTCVVKTDAFHSENYSRKINLLSNIQVRVAGETNDCIKKRLQKFQQFMYLENSI